MISVNVTVKDSHYTHMEISGHSESADAGEDVICAGVSSISFGLCNALDMLAGIETINVGNNKITIDITEPNDTTDLILETGVIQLRTVEDFNGQFMKVNITEE